MYQIDKPACGYNTGKVQRENVQQHTQYGLNWDYLASPSKLKDVTKLF